MVKTVLLFALLLSLNGSLESQKCTKQINERIECSPDHPNDSQICEQRKCCFSSETNGTKAPKCFFPTDYIGYEVKDIKKETNRITATLERKIPSGLPKDIQSVSVVVTLVSDTTLRIKVVDSKNKRFEPPIPELNLDNSDNANNPLFSVEISKNGLLSVNRKSNQKKIFETDLTKLIFSDQFHQMKSSLASNRIYGLGEHKAPFLKSVDWKIYTMFNSDMFPDHENAPLYGSHPFFLNVEDSKGQSNGVFLMNSNAIDILLTPEPAVTWRPIGGLLDLFVFMGPTAEDVVSQYVSLIGKPSMPPLWGLGYHQCRCCPAPHTLEEQKGITERTIAAGIPFDVQWNAKEYMVQFNDFTIDNKTFAGFGDWVRSLHKSGMHYVPIIDPGIDPTQPKGSYPPYDEGIEKDVFIKNASNHILIGKVWNKSGKTVWPDFSHPNATSYWTDQYKRFHKEVPIDGSWNDMNEIANFVDGSLDGCPKNELENPPYVPGGRPLKTRTLCLSAKHAAGVHYNVHNLYAYFMAISTNKALREVRQKRPFVISRASSPGLGKYSGHWDGDTYSTYDQLAWTIPSIMNFNLFGIPLVGGDICGFQGTAKNDSHFQELCARWLEVGAFYPFSRNHNTKKVDQDPVALGTTVVSAAKKALRVRYSLLPYLYTLFFMAESRGHTVVRPLFFEFPEDPNAYGIASETQFLWGGAFMVIPVVKPNQTVVNAYFPAGVWYPYTIELEQKPIESKGQFIELKAPIDTINTAVRGGHVLATLPPKQTTTEMVKQKFSLLVALDGQQKASGVLFWDDGDSMDTITRNEYSFVEFSVKNGTLNVKPIKNNFKGKSLVGRIDVLGVKSDPSSVVVDGKDVNYNYSLGSKKLSITDLDLPLFESESSVQWKY